MLARKSLLLDPFNYTFHSSKLKPLTFSLLTWNPYPFPILTNNPLKGAVFGEPLGYNTDPRKPEVPT